MAQQEGRPPSAGASSGERHGAFDAEAQEVTSAVREALAAAFAALDLDPTRPQDVARRLGLNKNLTWKLSKVVADRSPAGTVQHLPGRPGLAIFRAALRDRGASPTVLDRCDAAFARFEEFVRGHAGRREALAVMVGGTGGRPGAQDLLQRRLAFQGNSAIWGVQTRILTNTHLLLPSRTAGCLDVVVVRAHFDFQRLRPDVTWPIAEVRVLADGRARPIAGAWTPLDPALPQDAVPLVPRFCSPGLPPLRRAAAVDPGVALFEIPAGEVGGGGRLTAVLAHRLDGQLSEYRTPSDQVGEHVGTVNMPIELAVQDLVVHRRCAVATALRNAPPEAGTFGQLPGVPAYPLADPSRGRLPIEAQVEPLQQPAELALAEAPAYAALMDWVFERIGAAADQFVRFRLRVRYPPMPSVIAFRYPLPSPA